MFLVSSCLAGVNCTYRGKNNLNRLIKGMVSRKAAIAVCPELLGQLGVPRPRCEIAGGDGADVLDGKARVVTALKKDVTRNFVDGAHRALAAAERYGIKKAVLKSGSPSCSAGRIYDGTFSGTLKKGDGVAAALLKLNHIEVIGIKGLEKSVSKMVEYHRGKE